MKTPLLIRKIHELAIPPERISKNFYKFFASLDYEVFHESENFISSGYFLENINFMIIPNDIYIEYKSISYPFISEKHEIGVMSYCFQKKRQDLYFPDKYKIIKKNTCILYLKILSLDNEKDYIFDTI